MKYTTLAVSLGLVCNIAYSTDLCYKIEKDILSEEELLKDLDVTINLSKDILKEDCFSLSSGLKNELKDTQIYEFLENSKNYEIVLNRKKEVLVSLSEIYDRKEDLCSMDKHNKNQIIKSAIINIENQIKTSKYRIQSIKRDILRYKRDN